jgi:hypothetical protein
MVDLAQGRTPTRLRPIMAVKVPRSAMRNLQLGKLELGHGFTDLLNAMTMHDVPVQARGIRPGEIQAA